MWPSPGQKPLRCHGGHQGIEALGQLHWGKQALSHTDSSWQAMQVIKAELCRDRLGRGEWGLREWKSGRDCEGRRWGGREYGLMMTVSKHQPPRSTTNASPPALGAYTIRSNEKCCAELRCTDRRTGSPHSAKPPSPNLPS